MNDKYDVIIGLEIHVQTKTNSKMFCSCPTNYFHDEPNTHVCPVCFGLPGALPVPNKRAIELCILMGLATKCNIDSEIHFDRKHYFYPDLPKGYQISQYGRPICSNGYVMIKNKDGEDVKIELERIHQEEDVAKSTHHKEGNLDYTLIDYNKSGVPLIEIVTKPCIRSAYDAKEYASKIRQICRYLNISDADMEKGQMRCEPNISIQEKGKWEYKDGKLLAKGNYKLNPKVEIKNIGSISAVEKSIEYEVDRISEELEKGNTIEQQTRGWNADKGITEFQRSKETADDYRYMPEPDIPVIDISKEDIERISKELVELPDEKAERYLEIYGLSEYDTGVLTAKKEISEYFEKVVEELNKDITDVKEASKLASNWITGTLFSFSNTMGLEISEENIQIEDLAALIKAFKANILTKNKAEELLKQALEEKKDLGDLLDEFKKTKEEDNENIEDTISEILTENEQAVNDFKKGKQASMGYLIGQVMQKTHGSADPNTVRSILEKKLNE
jgi:aspartyl-tRNA(Asn)/glutamyl-tRNA(Gln) amidotransferase subunit B